MRGNTAMRTPSFHRRAKMTAWLISGSGVIGLWRALTVAPASIRYPGTHLYNPCTCCWRDAPAEQYQLPSHIPAGAPHRFDTNLLNLNDPRVRSVSTFRDLLKNADGLAWCALEQTPGNLCNSSPPYHKSTQSGATLLDMCRIIKMGKPTLISEMAVTLGRRRCRWRTTVCSQAMRDTPGALMMSSPRMPR